MYTNSNNAVEYKVLLHGLRIAVCMGVKCLEVRVDSNLAISQVNVDFDARDPKTTAYQNALIKISARVEGLEFQHIPRDNNQAADILAQMGAKQEKVPNNTFLERLFKPSVVFLDPTGTSALKDVGHHVPRKTTKA